MTVATRTKLDAALKAALMKQSKLHAWQVRSARRQGYQTYLVKTQLESERRTQDETHDVTVFVKNGDLLGRAAITINAGNAAGLEQHIADAAYMASLGGDAAWELPTGGEWPQVLAHDPALAGDQVRATAKAMVETWVQALAAHPKSRPSSMELFCGEDWVTLENSAGLIARSSGTRVSLLSLVLADGERPAERYSYDERRRASDLDVAAIVGRVADEAFDLTHATPPPSGQYPVVIDADELVAFLDPIQANASAEGLYQKSSRFEPGKPLPIEPKGGEPFNVVSNALVPFGLTSYPFDGNGTPGQRVEIVKDGVFTRPWATKQFADYLKTPPTGAFANWELPAGKTALADLLAGDGPVLHVRSFSWLTPDQARGNFGSEIRVGYLYEKGARRPIKGGTVSGSVFAALGTAHHAKETVFLGNYVGPAGIRFDGLTVTGA